jgi:polynucleotide 5'-kinase involved in rRNA processing
LAQLNNLISTRPLEVRNLIIVAMDNREAIDPDEIINHEEEKQEEHSEELFENTAQAQSLKDRSPYKKHFDRIRQLILIELMVIY